MKSIILCADDYGQNAVISQAIIDLIAKNHLSATSCMANSYYWPTHATWLNPYKNQVDIGLHLNFTEGKPLSRSFVKKYGAEFFGLPKLLFHAFTRKLDKQVIADEIEAQLQRFSDILGQSPDFIDGHQHVHQFPIIREALLEIFKKQLKPHGAYIRSVYDKDVFSRFSLKKLIIQLTGAGAFKAALREFGISTNSSFSGIYDFTKNVEYRTKFLSFLQEVNQGGLIMCHPGLGQQDETADPIYASRPLEYAYLISDQFASDLIAHQVQLSRLRDVKF